MRNFIKTVAIFTCHAGSADSVQDILVHMAAASRKEPGNLRWDLWQDQTDPARFVVDELYRDPAAAAAHRETPHYKKYAAAVGDLADRLVVRVNPVDIGS
jgi:quinol monooxygenase YgiN